MIIPGIILILLALLGGVITFLVGFLGWIILKLMKEELHLLITTTDSGTESDSTQE